PPLDVLRREQIQDGDERGVVSARAAVDVEHLVVSCRRRGPVHGPQPLASAVRVSRRGADELQIRVTRHFSVPRRPRIGIEAAHDLPVRGERRRNGTVSAPSVYPVVSRNNPGPKRSIVRRIVLAFASRSLEPHAGNGGSFSGRSRSRRGSLERADLVVGGGET